MINRLATRIRRALKRHAKEENADLRVSTHFAHIGTAGPLVTGLFERIKDIPGWFNVDDCGHFALILSYQNATGMRGDLLEIGSYHGRSTAIMATFREASDKIVVCDAFGSETGDQYVNKPTPDNLRRNLRRLSPHLSDDRVLIHECLSKDLELKSGQYFRFVHIDGGHSAEQSYQDLVKCARHTKQHGIIAMDDYHNYDWPGVTEGTDPFLNEHSGFEVLADLNRHGALGRKLYIIRRG